MTPALILLKGEFPYNFLDPFEPIHSAWWHLFGVPMRFVLSQLSNYFDQIPVTHWIGPLGLAIIVLTVLIKTIVFPLFHFQLTVSRRTQQEQRKIAPELAALRKKYKKDPQKLQAEMMNLYKEHHINPLAGALGCLPALVQAPILIALYWVIYGFSAGVPRHFLWVHDLAGQGHHDIVLALLAGGLTFIQSKMLAPIPTPGQPPDQAQQMAQQMAIMMPAFIAFLAWQFSPGIALYWVISTLYQIGQQYIVTGWGSLPVERVGIRRRPRPDPADGKKKGRQARGGSLP
jgi:YidC/Oxa1 family membrane protein insertase